MRCARCDCLIDPENYERVYPDQIDNPGAPAYYHCIPCSELPPVVEPWRPLTVMHMDSTPEEIARALVDLIYGPESPAPPADSPPE
jgi:hypothetical protein